MTVKYNVQTRQFETVPPEAHIPDHVKMRETLIERDPRYEEATHLHDGNLWIDKWHGTDYVYKVISIKEDFGVEVEKDEAGGYVKYSKSEIIGIKQ